MNGVATKEGGLIYALFSSVEIDKTGDGSTIGSGGILYNLTNVGRGAGIYVGGLSFLKVRSLTGAGYDTINGSIGAVYGGGICSTSISRIDVVHIKDCSLADSPSPGSTGHFIYFFGIAGNVWLFNVMSPLSVAPSMGYYIDSEFINTVQVFGNIANTVGGVTYNQVSLVGTA